MTIARTIITVDGIDGSGKSMFARRLLAGLEAGGYRGVAVSVDDFRRVVEWTTAADEADLYYDGYYDLVAAEAALAQFLAGAPEVAIPSFDVRAERVTGARHVRLEGVSVAVVEGVFPLRIPPAAAGMVIHLDTSKPEARRRIIARDLEKGRTREEIERRIDRRYFPAQERYRASFAPRDRADVVIDNERPEAPVALKRDLRRLPAALQPILDRLLPPTK
ncbi:MAG: putative kinase [Deltaproteobacteria bacterium]|nr:putative kinase [Deltaproteobacteria bacterium]